MDAFLSQFSLTNGKATSDARPKNTENSKANWFHLSYWFPDPLFLARSLHTSRSSAFRLLFSSLYGIVVFNIIIKPSYLILSSLSRSLATWTMRAPLDNIDQNFQTAAQQPDFKPTDPWGINSIREALKQQPALTDRPDPSAEHD